MKVLLRLLACTVVIQTVHVPITNACDLHDMAGFGQLPGFSPFASHLQRDNMPPPITIKSPFRQQAENNIPATVEINYKVPRDYKQAVMTINASENMQILGEREIPLEGNNGTYELTYRAVESGNHKVKVEIRAVNDDKPVIAKRSIRIKSM